MPTPTHNWIILWCLDKFDCHFKILRYGLTEGGGGAFSVPGLVPAAVAAVLGSKISSQQQAGWKLVQACCPAKPGNNFQTHYTTELPGLWLLFNGFVLERPRSFSNIVESYSWLVSWCEMSPLRCFEGTKLLSPRSLVRNIVKLVVSFMLCIGSCIPFPSPFFFAYQVFVSVYYSWQWAAKFVKQRTDSEGCWSLGYLIDLHGGFHK